MLFAACLVCRCILKESFDVLSDVSSRVSAAVTLDRDAILVHEELLEVPSDVRSLDRRPDDRLRIAHENLAIITFWNRDRVLEVCPERHLVCAVDVSASEHWEVRHVSVSGSDESELVNHLASLVVGLVAELVGGETEAHETVVRVLIHEVIHTSEIAHGRTSQSRHVLDEHDLTLVLAHRHDFAVKKLCLELVDRLGS